MFACFLHENFSILRLEEHFQPLASNERTEQPPQRTRESLAARTLSTRMKTHGMCFWNKMRRRKKTRRNLRRKTEVEEIWEKHTRSAPGKGSIFWEVILSKNCTWTCVLFRTVSEVSPRGHCDLVIPCYHRSKFETPRPNGSLVIVIKPKVKGNARFAFTRGFCQWR
jgi:hypothetical protein